MDKLPVPVLLLGKRCRPGRDKRERHLSVKTKRDDFRRRERELMRMPEVLVSFVIRKEK